MPALPLELQPERADAVRNRKLLLTTARRMLERCGVDQLTMDALAREAGLGKGTIFRRFGSRTGLLQALLNEIELDFQRHFISGSPPLGPGADPIDRLVAFGQERIRLLALQGDLLRAAEESPETRYASPARAAAHLHVLVLLRQSGVEGDIQVLAFNLLAALDATLVLHENREVHIPMERLANGWEELIRRATAPVRR
jgi:AcrR family transcriptional regulator